MTNVQLYLRNLAAMLSSLGTRRLVILGLAGALIFAGTGLAGYLLSRPSFELLYAGLDRQDVTKMGAALHEASIVFDVSADGTSVLVAAGSASRARMLLAEKGLPQSSNVGYELFDKMGSLGLTSFMQDVTRVRALEGELSRTIQTMQGVRAARVHLVLSDDGSFRRTRQPPSASVVLRTEGRGNAAMARAIRHLVSSSVAGLGIDGVTVLTTDGETLATGTETDLTTSGSALSLERTLADTMGDNIRRTLTPYLGLQNLRVSVAARLNTDRRQTNETVFNPDSRVERSVRTIKETQTSQNASSQAPTSVDRNIPNDKRAGGDGKQSNDETQKREEITNYEVSSKSVATVSGGYAVERLDVAILVNRAGFGDAKPEEMDRKLTEISELAGAAAGLRKERGDTIKVSAVVFHDSETVVAPSFLTSAAPVLLRQTGSVVNALAAVAVVALVLLLGAKPLLRLVNAPAPTTAHVAEVLAAPNEPIALAPDAAQPALEFVAENLHRATQRRLEQLAAQDEEGTAALLRHWIRSDTPA